MGELLFGTGIVLMCISVAVGLACMLIFRSRRKKLEEKLTEEYGETKQ